MHFFFFREAMGATIGEIIEALGCLAPWELAADWDNAGLQVGNEKIEAQIVAVALNAGEEEVSFAIDNKAQLLITHHPLIFNTLSRIDQSAPTGKIIDMAIREKLSIISAHTNLDAARKGLASAIAEKLSLEEVKPLRATWDENHLKMVVFLPPEALPATVRALTEIGAGMIGPYQGCFFHSRGLGLFTPTKEAKPLVGRVGKAEAVEEIRLETRIHRKLLMKSLEAVKKIHPYEEPVIEFYPLKIKDQAGFGRVGSRSISPENLIDEIKGILSCTFVRTVGRGPKEIRKIAVLPGSGGDFVYEAREVGADVLITGELRYHQALEASALGLWVIETGHQMSEALSVPLMAGYLRDCSNKRGWKLSILECPSGEDLYAII